VPSTEGSDYGNRCSFGFQDSLKHVSYPHTHIYIHKIPHSLPHTPTPIHTHTHTHTYHVTFQSSVNEISVNIKIYSCKPKGRRPIYRPCAVRK
jgi:hypothetical protein